MTGTVEITDGLTWREDPIVVTTVDLAKWAAATDDFTDFHFDTEAARARGFSAPVVNGPWKARALRDALVRKVGVGLAAVKRMQLEYRRPDVVGEPLTFEFAIESVVVLSDGTSDVLVKARVLDSNQVVSTEAEISLRVGLPEDTENLPLDRVRGAVSLGVPHGPFHYRIEAADVQRYQSLTGRPKELLDDVMPAAFFGAVDPVERRDLVLDDFLLDLPIPKVGGGNAFNEVEHERPIRVGETLAVTTTYTEVYEKKGRSSRLLFRVRENVFLDEAGTQVAKSRNGHVLAYSLSSGETS
jgi:acyl dehydratase